MISKDLKQVAKEIRGLTIECISSIGAGHIGGSMSIVDLLTVLYYKQMNIDPNNPKMEGRDRLVVSKGHAGPAVYATLASKGYFPKEELLTLNRFNTNLPSHCDMNKTVGVDMTTGSLGQGISCGVGLALASKIKNDNAHIYVIVGDGESQEGQVWEAAMFASHKKLDNLFVFLDCNKLQLDGYTADIADSGDQTLKWLGFGFDVHIIDGNNIYAIDGAIETAKQVKGKPHVIIMNTVKGKGVSIFEQAGIASHSMPIDEETKQKALNELGIKGE